MWKLVRCVPLEFDTFLEVDQIEFGFLGAVDQRHIRDQCVQESRFTRTGLARNECMLGRSAPKVESLLPGLPRHVRLAPRNLDWHLLSTHRPPEERCNRRALRRARIPTGLADPLNHPGDDRWFRWLVECERKGGKRGIFWSKSSILPRQRIADVFQVRDVEIPRHGKPRIRADQGANATGWAAARHADETLCGIGRKVCWKVGDHQHPVWLRHFTGCLVVVFNRLVLIPQIFLDHACYVIGQIGEALFDLYRLRPNLGIDELFIVIGQVHERGKVIAQPDRVDDGEADFPRR